MSELPRDSQLFRHQREPRALHFSQGENPVLPEMRIHNSPASHLKQFSFKHKNRNFYYDKSVFICASNVRILFHKQFCELVILPGLKSKITFCFVFDRIAIKIIRKTLAFGKWPKGLTVCGYTTQAPGSIPGGDRPKLISC